jgi:hypothetical protein
MYVHVTRGRFAVEHLAAARELGQQQLLPFLRTQEGCQGAWWLESDDDPGLVLLVVQCDSEATWLRMATNGALRAIEQQFSAYLTETPGAAGLWLGGAQLGATEVE